MVLWLERICLLLILLSTCNRIVGLASGAPINTLLISSFNNNSVLEYDAATGAFLRSFVTSGSGGLLGPRGMTFGPDSNLYVAGRNSSDILRYNGITGAFIDAFVSSGSGGLGTAGEPLFNAAGFLLVTSADTDQILRYNGTTGAFVNVFVPVGIANGPFHMAIGPDRNLYVGDFFNNRIDRFDAVTGAFLGVFAGGGGLVQPWQLTFGPDGNLYVGNSGGSNVLRYNGMTGVFMGVFVPSGSGGLSSVSGLAFGPDGNLFVANPRSNQVLRYNGTTGEFIDIFVTAGSGGLNLPLFLKFAGPSSGSTTCGATDITAQVTISQGPIFGIPPFVGLYHQTVLIRNGSQPIHGPLSFVLRGIPSSTTSLAGVYPGLTATNCFSTAPAGDTLFLLDSLLPPLNGDVLQPAQILQVGLVFASGFNSPTHYQPVLLSGTPNK